LACFEKSLNQIKLLQQCQNDAMLAGYAHECLCKVIWIAVNFSHFSLKWYFELTCRMSKLYRNAITINLAKLKEDEVGVAPSNSA
jgi:hypothetical protein